MPSFSEQSRERLSTCHPDLRRLFEAVVAGFDCAILEGVRTKERQLALYKSGVSKTLNSKHLAGPGGLSRAVDVAPCPIDWKDLDRFYFFAGYVRRTAEELGLKVRWGGDWDGDTEVRDNAFNDLVHWELKGDG